MKVRTGTELAVIDLSGVESSQQRQREVAVQIDEINRALGFFCIVGHGIAEDLVNRMHEVTVQFFQQPAEIKAGALADREMGMRGWDPGVDRGLGRSLGSDTPPDIREIFGSSRPISSDDPYYRNVDMGRWFFSGTNWPQQPAEFKAVWQEYYEALEGLATTLLSLMEKALGLEDAWFAPHCDRHGSMLISNYYPPSPTQVRPGQLRAGAHTDYGSFTIVHQDDAPGGLQVSDLNGGWTDVAPLPGSFVVNTGDLLARWTNDRWVSTVHRVVLPEQGAEGTPYRISVPFFHQPNPDAVIACLPGCEGTTGPKYPPVTSGRNWYNKNIRTLGGEPVSEMPG